MTWKCGECNARENEPEENLDEDYDAEESTDAAEVSKDEGDDAEVNEDNDNDVSEDDKAEEIREEKNVVKETSVKERNAKQDKDDSVIVDAVCHHCGKPLCRRDQWMVTVDEAFADTEFETVWSRQAVHCDACRRTHHPRVVTPVRQYT